MLKLPAKNSRKVAKGNLQKKSETIKSLHKKSNFSKLVRYLISLLSTQHKVVLPRGVGFLLGFLLNKSNHK